jgi:hypothetical protein
MNPRTVLQERYPLADFFEYFRFLGECAGTVYDRGHTQQHHICPRAQFAEYIDEPDNKITLLVADHVHAHKLLEAACRIKALSPALFAAQAEGASKGGRIGGRTNAESGHMRSIGLKQTSIPEHQAMAARAGRNGGRISGGKNAQEMLKQKRGIFSPGAAARGGKAAGLKNAENGHLDTLRHNRWHVKRSIISPTCELCHV